MTDRPRKPGMQACCWAALALLSLALRPAAASDGYEPAGRCGDWCLRGDDSGWGMRLEYLMWFSGGEYLPALVATSPAGTPRADAGVLGRSGTEILFGNQEVGQIFRNGARLTLDYKLSDDCDRRIAARMYGVEDGRETFVGTPGDNDILARPFNNVQLGSADSLLISFPGVVSNSNLFAQTRNDFFGADLYLQQRICDDGCHTLDWLAGYQFARLDDALFIRSSAISIDPNGLVPVDTEVEVIDHFRTQNEFHGATLGVIGVGRSGSWRLEGLFKLALGNIHQSSIVDGRTTTTAPNQPSATAAGGLLALPTNIGTFSRDRLTIVPEVNVNIGYQVDDRWSLLFGYSFLYLPNAVLAGGQIDTRVNLSQVSGPLAGPVLPAPKLENAHYWLQGMSLGAEYRF